MDGLFRADLYYRINMLSIHLPALRESLPDIEPLADAPLDDLARRSGLAHKNRASDGLDRLLAHPWRDNIRELRNALEQAALMTDDLRLTAAHLDEAMGLRQTVPGADVPGTTGAAAAGPGLPAVSDMPADAGASAAAAVPAAAAVSVGSSAPPLQASLRPLPEQVAELERRAMADALRATGGNRLAASRLLKISRAAFYDKLARYPELTATQAAPAG